MAWPRRRSVINIGAALVAGGSLFVLVILLAGTDQIDAIFDADPVWVAVSFAVGTFVTALSALRWGMITNILAEGPLLSWRQYWAALLTSRVLGLFVPRNASDLGVRFVALTGVGRSTPEVAVASVSLDQMFDITLLAAWLIPSLLLLSGVGGGWTLWLVPVAAGLAVLAMMKLDVALRWAAAGLARLTERLGQRSRRLARFFGRRSSGFLRLADVAHFESRQTLALASMTLLRFALTATMFWAIASAIDLHIDLWTFALVGPAVQLSLVIAFTPGGLGIMDLGLVGLLALAGTPSEEVAAFVVGQRAFQYTFFPMAAGLSYLATSGSVTAIASQRHDPTGEAF